MCDLDLDRVLDLDRLALLLFLLLLLSFLTLHKEKLTAFSYILACHKAAPRSPRTLVPPHSPIGRALAGLLPVLRFLLHCLHINRDWGLFFGFYFSR